MQIAAEKSIEYNKPTYVFVDLEKAFNRVELKDVTYLLYNREIPHNIIKIIENIKYTYTMQTSSRMWKWK